MDQEKINERLAQRLAEAVRRLDPDDRLEREVWCVVFGRPGAQMHLVPGGLMFRWGGRDLLFVQAGALEEDGALEFVPTDVPDTVPDDWGGDGGL